MRHDVLIAGFGGQGILLMGQLIAEAAMDDGLFVTWFPSYGPEMRGGTANCTTVYSDAEIGSPISARYDFVIAMNQPSLERFGPLVREGGALLVNASMVPIQFERQGIRIAYIAATELAQAAGAERVGNVVMLGALLGMDSGLSLASFDRVIQRLIGRKRPEMVAVNLAALRAGQSTVLDNESTSHPAHQLCQETLQ